MFLYSPCLGSNQSKKLARPWTGPYYIVAKPSPIHVRLRRVSDNKAVPNLVHVNRVKQYQNGPQMGDAHPQPRPRPHPHPCRQPSPLRLLVLWPRVLGYIDGSARSSDGNVPSEDQEHVDSHTPSAAQDVPDVKDTNSSVSEQTKFYEVERVLCRRYRQGQWQYRVKWLSYPSSANSWVPFSNLSPTCQKLVVHTHKQIPVYRRKR